MAFGSLTLTNNGRYALTNAQVSGTLEFAYIAIGDGKYTGSFKDIANLKNELFHLEIKKAEVQGDVCVLEVDLTNADLTEGYYLREIGIFVKTDSGDVLYVYDNAGNDAEYIPQKEGSVSVEKRLRFTLKISEVSNITVETTSVLYMTQLNFEKHVERLGYLAYLDKIGDTQIINVLAEKVVENSTRRFVTDIEKINYEDKYTRGEINIKFGALGELAYLNQVGNSQISDVQALKVIQNAAHRFVTDMEKALYSDKYTRLEIDGKFGALGVLAYRDTVTNAQIIDIAAAKVTQSSTRRFVTDTQIAGFSDKYTKNEIDNLFSALETSTDWKEAVATFADIAKTYPNPQDGWTVNVRDTDYTYRWSGKEWIAISANAIPKATATVDGLMGIAEWIKLNGIAANANNYVHPTSGVTAGTFQRVTVNAQGHVTGGNNNTVTLAEGGTGATTAAAAWTNLVRQGGEITGQLILSRTTDVNAGNSSEGALVIGNKTGAHLAFDGNEIMAKSNATTAARLDINADGGLVVMGPGGLRLGGNLQMYNATSTRTSTVLDLRGGTDVNGDALLITAGGLTVIGGGESPQSFYDLGTLSPSAEQLYLTSDQDIVFLVNCQTIANRIGVNFSRSGYFSPLTDNTVYLGSPSFRYTEVHAIAFKGRADSATTLANQRTINGTNFNGTANITTAHWGTARNISIATSDGTGVGATTSVNGSGNITLRLPATIKAALTGNADTASKLLNARSIQGVLFDGTENISLPVATTTGSGLMSSADKTKLNGIASNVTTDSGGVINCTSGTATTMFTKSYSAGIYCFICTFATNAVGTTGEIEVSLVAGAKTIARWRGDASKAQTIMALSGIVEESASFSLSVRTTQTTGTTRNAQVQRMDAVRLRSL